MDSVVGSINQITKDIFNSIIAKLNPNIANIIIHMHPDTPELEGLELHEILQSSDIVMAELLSIPNIGDKIKNSLPLFVEYCHAHPDFAFQLIDIAIKCPMHMSSTISSRTLTYVASDILTNDSSEIANLLIHSGIEELESDQDTIDTIDETALKREQRKYQFLNRTLEYVEMDPIDESCLNYMCKVVNCLFYQKKHQFLAFFSYRPTIMDQMIKLSNHPSMSQLLSKILAEDCSQQACYAIKEVVLQNLLNYTRAQIDTANTYLYSFIDDLLQATKCSEDSEKPPLFFAIVDKIVSEEALKTHCLYMREDFNFWRTKHSVDYLSLALCNIKKDTMQEQLRFKEDCLYREIPFWLMRLDEISQGDGPIQLESLEEMKTLQLDWITLIFTLCQLQLKLHWPAITHPDRTAAICALLKIIAKDTTRGVFKNTSIRVLEIFLTVQSELPETLQLEDLMQIANRNIKKGLLKGHTPESNSLFRKLLCVLYLFILQKYPQSAPAFLDLFREVQCAQLIAKYTKPLEPMAFRRGNQRPASELQFAFNAKAVLAELQKVTAQIQPKVAPQLHEQAKLSGMEESKIEQRVFVGKKVLLNLPDLDRRISKAKERNLQSKAPEMEPEAVRFYLRHLQLV